MWKCKKCGCTIFGLSNLARYVKIEEPSYIYSFGKDGCVNISSVLFPQQNYFCGNCGIEGQSIDDIADWINTDWIKDDIVY